MKLLLAWAINAAALFLLPYIISAVKVPSFTTVGAYIQYRAPKDAGVFAGTRFKVGARNLFDTPPPLTSSNASAGTAGRCTGRGSARWRPDAGESTSMT